MTPLEEKAIGAATKLLMELSEEAVREVVRRCAMRAAGLAESTNNHRCRTLARRLRRCADRGVSK
jgi:hypothetical protein